MAEAIDISEQIPRRALFWLLFAQVALVIPHVEGLPWWLFIICAICGIWRILIYRQWLVFPGKLAKVLIVGMAFLAIGAGYRGRFSLDPMVAMIVIAFFLKLLETRRLRDIYIVIILGFFIAATRLLYSQTLYATLYALACCMLLLLALLGLHQSEAVNWRTACKRILILSAQASPVLIVLFFLFPRVPPLWSVPMPQQQGSSGLSDQLTPGMLGSLAQDPSPVFRVGFTGQAPAARDQYWRGLVFDRMEGKTWMQNYPQPVIGKLDVPQGAGQAYRLTMEPHFEHWLFTLPDSYSDDPRIVALSNGMLASRERIRLRSAFNLFSVAGRAPVSAHLDPDMRQRNLQLPKKGNPRSRLWAQQLAVRHADPMERVTAVLDNFETHFTYTLKPGTLGGDSIDEFLFDTQRGYCEHFATAFVFLMRASGIPARAIGGYQGGEINPYEDFILIRQLDAHAWAEIWLEGKGWLRIDPTAVVAPERIAEGAESALRERDEFAPGGWLGLVDFSGLAWLNTARLWLDSVNYQWSLWFLGYDNKAQADWLLSWWGKSDWESLIQLLVIGLGIVISSLFAWTAGAQIFAARKVMGLATQAYRRILRLQGVNVQADSTLAGLTRQLVSHCPATATAAWRFTDLHEAFVYAETSIHWRQRYLEIPHLLISIAISIVISGNPKPVPDQVS